MKTQDGITLRTLAPRESTAGKWLALLGPTLDRLLQISVLDGLYRAHRLQNLPPFEFSSQTLRVLNIAAEPLSSAQLADKVPSEGSLLVVCNHPYGGIEALLLAHVLQTVRTDVKFLANTALKVFPEFQPLMIATNPLVVTQKNLRSIRQCENHLGNGGLLVVFPAGRVSSYQKNKDRIMDGQWNRIVGHLARQSQASLLPVFFHGNNSRLFHLLGRLWNRSRLLMLPREFLKLRGRKIRFDTGLPITARSWHHLSVTSLTHFARTITHLQAANTHSGENDRLDTAPSLEPLAPLGNRQCIVNELAALPAHQHLLDFKHFSVFYAMASQIPVLMPDIARERERVFRAYDEGSGQPRDSDNFDQTYTQLFVWDNLEQSLVGAYRLGKTDLLLNKSGASGLYLNKMFEFDKSFHRESQRSLELGRSFVAPEYQNSFHALYLLWKGIGRFLVKHPQYRRLYGTVSLSRQYSGQVIDIMCNALITPSAHVHARQALPPTLNSEWLDYCASNGKPDLKTLSAFVRGLDHEGKDLPILLKHYYKLGAKFHCVGIDKNFNNTPGLLLSIDMTALQAKVMSTYFGEGAKSYLDHSKPAP